jgi:putative hemolysin
MTGIALHIFLWMVFLVFLFLAAFFAFSETAVIALDRVKLRHLVQKGKRKAKAAEWLKENPRQFFGVVLIGTNVAVVVLAAIGSHYLFFPENLLIATIIVDAIVLIFAEIAPKSLALRKPTHFSIIVGSTVKFLVNIFGWLVNAFTFLPSKLFDLDVGDALAGADLITEMQIKTMVDVGEEEGTIDAGEGEMIGNVIDTGNMTVEELMIPSVDVVYLREGDKLRDAVKLNIEYGLSRFPVYSDNEDDVLGFMHTKDIIGIYLKGGIDDKVENHLRTIEFVPESKPVIDLLYELKETRSHIAMVVDEYGQTTGLITLEDLLEEVVGDIYDESDKITRHITKIGVNKYLLSGSLEIEETENLLGVKITGEFETVAGFVMGLLGRIPVKDDRIVFSGWQFKIGQMDKRRIRSVMVKKLNGKNGEANGSNE